MFPADWKLCFGHKQCLSINSNITKGMWHGPHGTLQPQNAYQGIACWKLFPCLTLSGCAELAQWGKDCGLTFTRSGKLVFHRQGDFSTGM